MEDDKKSHGSEKPSDKKEEHKKPGATAAPKSGFGQKAPPKK